MKLKSKVLIKTLIIFFIKFSLFNPKLQTYFIQSFCRGIIKFGQ